MFSVHWLPSLASSSLTESFPLCTMWPHCDLTGTSDLTTTHSILVKEDRSVNRLHCTHIVLAISYDSSCSHRQTGSRTELRFRSRRYVCGWRQSSRNLATRQ